MSMTRQEFYKEVAKIIVITIQYNDSYLRWRKLSEHINGMCDKLELY